MSKSIDLIADGIENPRNARALIDVARMFGSVCRFRDRKGLYESLKLETLPSDYEVNYIQVQNVVDRYSPIISLENLENAIDIFGYNFRSGLPGALIVGNERYGVSHEMHNTANYVLHIPMTSFSVNTLNVATTAGVALYYLMHGPTARMHVRAQPEKRRPEILLVGGNDPMELGSVLRSAAAFGWERAFLEDRGAVWFGRDHLNRSEEKNSARRGRNTLKLYPVSHENRYAFKKVTVVSRHEGVSLPKSRLAEGPQQLVIIPDESAVDVVSENWHRAGANVQFVKIEVPSVDYKYHYRVFASIALAEISRQVGHSATERYARKVKQGPVYDKFLSFVQHGAYEEIDLEDLTAF